ncbi:type II secretion system protein [Vibrio scophthalmi]|uniref:Prepilin-type N-terminal cleavage/methylation domain-containing protein n=1 Tax=Vibrio scophthalmi TaxID=45658 RepID=A0A1E3WS45_9VIBR|nr:MULTISPECIES: type II secretion system protein [Vibrio]EGU29435.1 hypothetical protein VIBRN418_14466 [Vibrio sp. N418]MCY9802071.1 type II secretion system protein [Vibrio scophthalmi]ODS11862.1 hypothetical protein VSF3289_02129 [Vibrio scophthalmi]
MNKNNQSGFTLIELVVVIVILAILAVVAFPRFVSYQRDAHLARADAAFASFENAVQMYHSKWLTEGETSNVVDYGEGDIYPSSTGFPISIGHAPIPSGSSSSNAIRGEDCVNLWHALTNNDLTIRAQHEGSGVVLPSSTDIVSWYTGADECYYYYTPSFSIDEKLPILYYEPLTGKLNQTTERPSF